MCQIQNLNYIACVILAARANYSTHTVFSRQRLYFASFFLQVIEDFLQHSRTSMVGLFCEKN